MSNIKVLPLLEPEVAEGVVPCCPPLTERPLTAEEAERTAAMFKALGDPVRLRLFSLVASHEGGEACVCDISDVGVSQPTVSHHLKKLRRPACSPPSGAARGCTTGWSRRWWQRWGRC